MCPEGCLYLVDLGNPWSTMYFSRCGQSDYIIHVLFRSLMVHKFQRPQEFLSCEPHIQCTFNEVVIILPFFIIYLKSISFFHDTLGVLLVIFQEFCQTEVIWVNIFLEWFILLVVWIHCVEHFSIGKVSGILKKIIKIAWMVSVTVKES